MLSSTPGAARPRSRYLLPRVQLARVHPVVGEGDGDAQRISRALVGHEPVEGGSQLGGLLFKQALPGHGI